jgi:hypothetical protein
MTCTRCFGVDEFNTHGAAILPAEAARDLDRFDDFQRVSGMLGIFGASGRSGIFCYVGVRDAQHGKRANGGREQKSHDGTPFWSPKE